MSKDNKNSSRTKCFPQVIAPLDTKDAASKTPVKFLHEKFESFLLNIKSSWENSDKNRISWDSSPWNLDCNFDNPAEKIPAKGPIVLAQCAKIVLKYNFKNFSPVHCSSGHVGCSFKNPATTFNQNGQNFLLNMNSSWEKTNKKMVYVNLNFLTRKLHFCNNAENFPPTG